MKINAVTSGANSPSGWYRIGILKDLFLREGIYVNEFVPKVSSYPPLETLKRPVWLLSALVERLTYIARLRGADVTILQRELISTLPTVERFLPGRKILDVYDAIFLRKGGFAARNAARSCLGVVCGNQYLADYFSNYNDNVCIIPTGVNVSDMRLDHDRLSRSERKIVGWIGTPGNLSFFEPISRHLLAFFQDYSSRVEFRIVTSDQNSIPSELRKICRFVKWYPGIEFDELPKWSVGLMPLVDSEWVKGKCSFKMLQYMSAGVPVVVSPYGMNQDILSRGDIGFGPHCGQDWYNSLKCLIEDEEVNTTYGRNARYIAEAEFSLETVVANWLEIFEKWL